MFFNPPVMAASYTGASPHDGSVYSMKPPIIATLILLLAAIFSACETLNTTVRKAADRADALIPEAPTPAPAVFREEPDLRIRVLSAVSNARIDGPSRLLVRAANSDATLGLAQSLASPVTVSSSSNGFRLTDARGQTRDFRFGADIELLAAATPRPAISGGSQSGESRRDWEESVRVNGVRYPGFVALRARWSNNPNIFDAIAVMAIEAYIPGVLAHEIGKDWPRQAFEAQAVAARTYALHERDRARRDNKPFDVESNTNDQVYGGGGAASLAIEATRATRGQILQHNGDLLRAYFSSTCGGRPASAAHAWPARAGTDFNKAAPLQGKSRKFACQSSKFYRWEVARTDDDLTRRLRTWGKTYDHDIAGLSRLRAVTVKDRNDAGRPNRYTVIDSNGREFALAAEELRAACNQHSGNLPAITDKTRVLSGDMEFEVLATRVRIQGRGWGHGVGMCQFCAKGFAQQGMDWATMMKEFYPGAEVRKAY